MWSSKRAYGEDTVARRIALLVLVAGGLALLFVRWTSDQSTVSLPWAVIDHPSPRVYNLLIYDGGCDNFSDLFTQQAPGGLRVTAVGTRTKHVSCDSDLRTARAILTLTRSQVGTPFVHSPVSSPWDMPFYTRGVRRAAHCISDGTIC
jgi:hypothetical protein